MTEIRYGAYGFAIDGIERADEWLMPVPSDWPLVTIGQRIGAPAAESYTTPDDAFLSLIDERGLHVTRESSHAMFVGPDMLPTAALVHPYMAPAFSVLAHWAGWIAFHGGGFVVDDQAWILTARTGRGKSTTLAAMAEAGYPIVSDDLAVMSEGQVYAGPRSVDLREQSIFERAVDLGKVGRRPRWRLPLGDVPSRLPVAGVVKLDWSDSVVVRSVPLEERVELVSESLSIRTDRFRMLRIMVLPTVEVRRPKSDVGETVDLILKAIQMA